MPLRVPFVTSTTGIIIGVKRVLTISENVRIGVVSKTLEESELQQ